MTTLLCMTLLTMGLIGAARALDRLHGGRPGRALVVLRDDRSGTATMEFALVLPFVMFMGLTLTQVTLMMAGQQFVHYAAYAATRSAVTWIPRDESPYEPRNVIEVGGDSTKMSAIRRAGILAVAPAGGRLASSDAIPADQIVEGIRGLYEGYGAAPPRWVTTLAGDRLRYAAANTRVVLMRTEVEGDDVRFVDLEDGLARFGPREAVSVRVEHRLHLAVPYVRKIFEDGRHDGSTGQGAYVNVSAQYTLVNFGIEPTLPPRPSLPRINP